MNTANEVLHYLLAREDRDEGFELADLCEVTGIAPGAAKRTLRRLERDGDIALVAYPHAGLGPAYVVKEPGHARLRI